MANWSQVGYRIEGKQKDLQEIYELFGEFDKGERKPFDELSAKNWEGNIDRIYFAKILLLLHL